MDLLFVTIILLWVFTELMLFYLKYDNKTDIVPERPQIVCEFDIDSNKSFNLSCSSEGDSGINGTSTEESEASVYTSTSKKSSMKISKQQLMEIEKSKKRAMAKRLARQERDRKQLEQYLRSKQTIKSDGHIYGSKANASFMEMLDCLYNFVQYIRKYRIISLEDMAIHFKLRPQEIVEHIKNLQSIGIITGVLDDRGKFIYVPETESKAVGRFIQQQHIYHWPRKALI